MSRLPYAPRIGVAPIVPPKRKPKRQRESSDQRAFVKALNAAGMGFFYRVKNMGTFDPVRGIYRKHGDMEAIPDICGADKRGRGVFIECKYVKDVEKKRKLIFKAKITEEQKGFLLRMYRLGALAGVAFTLEDAIAIAANDERHHPRHPRTWMFLPDSELLEKADAYEAAKKELARIKADPLARDILSLASQESASQDAGPDTDPDC